MYILYCLHQGIDKNHCISEISINFLMKTFFGVSIMLLVFIQASTQEYSIRTNETDSFSKAFVQLLQCAADKFENCRGKFLQYTMLQENEFELAIPFPGS